jgi:hypothetical protein
MRSQPKAQKLGYASLVAPLVLVIFVLGWYEFSVVYIQSADDQLVANNNLAVYVPIQQVQGYLSALLDAVYFAVFAGLIVFAYRLATTLRSRSRMKRAPA